MKYGSFDLKYIHDCPPWACPDRNKEVVVAAVVDEKGGFYWFPDVRCIYTRNALKKVEN